jgi:signal transduction histidine kinase
MLLEAAFYAEFTLPFRVRTLQSERGTAGGGGIGAVRSPYTVSNCLPWLAAAVLPSERCTRPRLQMKSPVKERLSSSAVVIALAGVLAVLGVLQYRWSREVSQAASDRMRSNLQTSMVGMRQDLYRELSALGMAFQSDPASHTTSHDADAFAQRLREWSRSAAHPSLVKEVFVFENAQAPGASLLRLNTATSRFDAAEWPPELERFHAPLQALAADLAVHGPILERFREHRNHAGAMHPDGPPASMRDHGGNMFFQRRGMRGGPWTVDLATPALLHLEIDRASNKPDAPAKVAWIILDLDQKLIQEHILPEIAQRYFGSAQGLIFDVAVVNGDDNQQVLYTSNPQLVSKAAARPDAMMPLFGPLGGPVMLGPGMGGAPPTEAPGVHRDGPPGPVHLDPVPLRAQGGDWRLIVQHRKGSLEAAVTSLYRRNLAISFGILLVLAATMTMIVITARRAQRLARLQMDFVAGVSHELRTPLAVINSAAENIADGIVDNKQRLVRYGNVIRKQVGQLTQLVEQILLFSATHNGGHQFNMKVVEAREVVDRALANTEDLTRAASFDVERHVDANLPPIRADLLALSQCVQNLITNAVKYSGDARWIAVRATAAGKSDQEKEVLISVEDHGVGIAAGELGRIFDPFYRSPSATAAQIHGTGLGLSLARKIAEGMCGRITVASEPGRGSCFTLHLPAANEADREQAQPEVSVATRPD